MTRRRRVKLVRNPEHAGHLPYDEWIPAHAVRFNSDGSTTLMTEAHHNRGMRNVTGYKDASGIFHPIRWDPDYDPDELITSSEPLYPSTHSGIPKKRKLRVKTKKRRRR